MSEPETFYHMPSAIIVLRPFDTRKYTIKLSLTKTVFSFANSVDASQNTCIVSKQEVPNEYDRKPDSATFGILLYFCNLSQCYGLDINTRDRHILAKKAKKCNEKSHTETFYIYFDNAFINTASLNSSEIIRFF